MTKRSLSALAAVGLAVALAGGTAAAQQVPPGVEKELRAAADEFAAAWNRADAKSMAALFAEDADLINPFGKTAKGRAGIEAFFANELSTLTKGTHFTVKGLTPRLLRATLAVEDLDVEIGGGTLAPDPAKPLRNHAFLVLKRENGHWLVINLRAFSYLPPPPSPAAK